MGWEMRHGRLYLYRNRRVNGKPVKHYIGAAHARAGFGQMRAYLLGRLQRRAAKLRRLRRSARAAYRERIDDLSRASALANADLRAVADGTLCAPGFHKHNRGEWRIKLELALLRRQIGALEKRAAEPTPLLQYEAPTGDEAAVELFAKARSGDPIKRGSDPTPIQVAKQEPLPSDEKAAKNDADPFDRLTFEQIKGLLAGKTARKIDANPGPTDEIPPGTVLVYRTNERRYGKCAVVKRTDSTGSLELKWLTYDATGKTFGKGDYLEVRRRTSVG